MNASVWVAVVASLLLAGCAQDRPPGPDAPTGAVGVTVLDIEFRPVAGATVTLSPGGASNVTTEAGTASLRGVDFGNYTLTVTKPGWETHEEPARLTQVEPLNVTVILKPVRGPLFDVRSFQNEGHCRRDEVQAARGDAPCGPNAAATLPDPDTNERFLKDVYNLSFVIQWEGADQAFEFEIRFAYRGGSIPFADGALNQTVRGTSPLKLTLREDSFSKAMKRPNNLLQVTPLRPIGTHPQTYDQAFDVRAVVWFRDPSAIGKTPNQTMRFDRTYALPGATGGTQADDRFSVNSTGSIWEARILLQLDCPQYFQDASLRMTDPGGRSLRFPFPTGGGVCTPTSQPFVEIARQVLWESPGLWAFQSSGQCACRLRFTVIEESWPGL